MRSIGRTLAGLVLLICIGFGIWEFGVPTLQTLFSSKVNKEKLALLPQASLSLGYLADSERWLTFPVNSGTTRLKVISNANVGDLENIRRQRSTDPTRRWNYALDIEVWSDGERPILERTHHLRTDISEFTAPDGRHYTPAFYLNNDLTPMSGAVIALDMTGLPAASTLRIRLARKDADIDDVLVRVYQPENLSEQRAAVAWKRMSDKARESLSKSSVYPQELLQESEIRNLLLNAWQAIGPRGAEGRDYHQRSLYVLFDNDGDLVDDPIPSRGALTSPQKRSTIPVPEGGGELRLELEDAPFQQAPGPTEASAIIRWYGTSLFEHHEQTLHLSPGKTSHTQRVEGGLLEIETPREMTVRAWLRRASGNTETNLEITPQPQYRRSYLASSTQAVTYVLELRREASVLRLELRRLLSATSTQATRAQYEIRDSAGKTLKTGWIPLDLPPSYYEQVLGDYSGARLSDPGIFHFLLPAAAHSLQILAEPTGPESIETPLLVAAQTRPYRLAREIRVPEDAFDFDAKGNRIPAWFPLQPDNFEEMVINNRFRTLLLQARPPVAKPELLAGHYQWEDIRPHGNWLARPIFTPREAGAPYRPDILPSTYTPLPLNRWIDLEFPPYHGLSTLTPTLVWLGEKGTLELQLETEDRAPLNLRLVGPFAERELPPMRTGRHRIRINGPNTGKIFINHVRPAPGALVRRLGQRFSGQLSFDYERQTNAEETLTIRLFQPQGHTKGTRLQVNVQSPEPARLQPLNGWIFPLHQAMIRPDHTFDAPVFDTNGERSDAGQAIYIPFTTDSPRGRYQITVRAEPGSSGYLGMTRLGPEISPQRRIHVQPELRHAHFVE